MNFYNRVLDKKGLKRIVSWFIENYGPTRTSVLLDDFKYLGFHYAGQAGLSLGFDDLRIPPTKKLLLESAQEQVQDCEKTYIMGRITAFERYQKLIDIWTTTSEKLKDEVIQNFEKIQGGPLASPLYMMAFSGARGNISQVRQLVGMRGLMSDSGGGIIDFPIRSNFREGLSVTEYVISCYGARKGLIDTALKTADSGYLTRRLVDVAHGIIIREIDCGSLESISVRISDIKNLVGRVLAETVQIQVSGGGASLPGVSLSPSLTEGADQRFEELRSGERPAKLPLVRSPTVRREPRNHNRMLWRNQEISFSVALELKSLKGQKSSVQVRSPLTCLSQSVCQLCYGWNLAQGRLVSLGDAVGILAAQSIGEPGTQLTMRTFHTGGIFSTEVEDKLYSPQDGFIFLQKRGKGDEGVPREAPTALLRTEGELRSPKVRERDSPPGAALLRPTVRSSPPPFLKIPDSRGCKIRSVHGQTAFFFFDSIQLKIKTEGSTAGVPRGPTVSSDESDEGKAAGSFALKVTDQSSHPFQQESILQLPAQSILFISPGKYIRKNSLFAEISRIQQPPEKIQEVKTTVGPSLPYRKSRGVAPAQLDSELNDLGSEAVRSSLSTQKYAEGASLTSLRGQEVGAPAVFAPEGRPQKKVFSEIQGEVVEKSISGAIKGASLARGYTAVWSGETSQLRKTTSQGGDLPGAAELPKLTFSQTRKLKESRELRAGFPPRERPLGAGYPLGSLIKSRIVLAAEPFIFKRKPTVRSVGDDLPPSGSRSFAPPPQQKVRTRGPSLPMAEGLTGERSGALPSRPPVSFARSREKFHQPTGGYGRTTFGAAKPPRSSRGGGYPPGELLIPAASYQKSSGVLSLGNDKMELPFRMGDVLFWKGKRKLNNPNSIQGNERSREELREGVPRSEREELRSFRAIKGPPVLLHSPSLVGSSTSRLFSLRRSPPSALWSSIQAFEIRRSGERSSPEVLLRSSGAKRARENSSPPEGQDTESPPLMSDRTASLAGPLVSEALLPLLSLSPNLSGLILLFDQQKQQNIEAREGRTSFAQESEAPESFAPYPFGEGGTGGLQIGKIIQPHIALSYLTTEFTNPLGTCGPHQRSFAPPPEVRPRNALNIPTQIIRKRGQRLILRRVQPHLGGENFAVEGGGYRRAADQQRWGGEVSPAFTSHPSRSSPSLGHSLGTTGARELRSADQQLSQRGQNSVLDLQSLPARNASAATRYVKERDLLFNLVLPISQSSSSSDIVQGLPKIEQLFEARSKNENTAATKGPAKPVRAKLPEGHSRASASEQSGASLLPNEAPRVGKKASGERAKLSRAELSVVLGNEAVRSLGASPASPHQPPTSLLKAELRNLQKRLIQEIQAVYNSQGVEIADKHLEIIVRQMTSRIRILEKGNTPFFPEDIVEFFGQQETGLSSSQTTLGNESCGPEVLRGGEVESRERSSSSRELRLERGSLALRSSNLRSPSPKNVQSLTEIPAYEWVLLGITKVALLATTESYISAASFQETKRVLMSSALQSRVDFFEGLKENVIVGRIIPAGTGYNNA